MKIKEIAVIVTALLLAFLFAGCNTKTYGPYLSIAYERDNPKVITGREIVFYSYDINSKVLKEECALPAKPGHSTGVFSRYDNAVYYQSKTIPRTYPPSNSLWRYDIEAQEAFIIDDENHKYKDILLIDPNTLLLTMRIDEQILMPVLFDIKSKTFTYMADVNNEPFIYTTGNNTPIYNYKTGEFTCVYWNYEDGRNNEYYDEVTEIDRYIALVSRDLVKDPQKIFSHRAKINEMNMYGAVQISENELLVTMVNMVEKREPLQYYSLVFNGGEATFTPTDCPYPYTEHIYNLYTVDGGKTFYFNLLWDDFGNPAGIYSYDTETDKLTPILLNDPEVNGHNTNLSIVGP